MKLRNFLVEDLDDCYPNFIGAYGPIFTIFRSQKRNFVPKKTLFSEKLLAFLYSSMIKFCRTAKIKKCY